MTRIAVAAVSARCLAQAAAQAGWGVVALDCFGDADTRAASVAWLPVGDGLSIDPAALDAALDEARRRFGCEAWIYGAGFDGRGDLIAIGHRRLPTWGLASARQAMLREPARFFGTLAALGLVHPPVRFDPPADAHGWLVKSATGCGGWHIAAAAGACAADGAEPGREPGRYWQQADAGEPMSALFLADGRRALRVGLNRLLVQPCGERPCVYHGAIGPVLRPGVEAVVDAALRSLVAAFPLAGLASLDFLAGPEPDAPIRILEINARPSATLALYTQDWPHGLLRAHVDALNGRLPPHRPPAGEVRGERIVFADRALDFDPDAPRWRPHLAQLRDRPAARQAFATGDPVCTVAAAAADEATVERELRARAGGILALAAHEPERVPDEVPE